MVSQVYVHLGQNHLHKLHLVQHQIQIQKRDISSPSMFSNSSFNLSKSQDAISPTLLSAKRNALTCCGVKSFATIQGTSSSPNEIVL